LTPIANVYNTNNQINATGYDAKGNQTTNGGYVFAYHAENRLISTNMFGTTYVYDADGRRVTKTSSGVTTTYVYDVTGQLAAQYATGGTAPCPLTCYLMTDHLGSTRMQTDHSGNQLALFDYAPFGEELAGADGRDARWGGFGSGIHFTGKEQEGYEGDYMHYFEARYLSGGLGRFMSPDPDNAGSFPSDPQTWNAYAYVRNNPLKYRDPHGLTYRVCDADGKNCGYLSDADFEGEQNADRSNGAYFSSGSIYHYDSNGNRVNDGSYVQTDVDIDNPAFGAVRSGALAVKTPVNVLGYATLGMLTGGFGIEAAGLAEGVTLIPGLAPTSEYTSAILALDVLGESNTGASLSPAQARALAQNVVDVLNKTIPNAEARGTDAFVQAVRNQLANPRFQFLDQIPGPLKEELVRAAGRLGIAVK